MARLQLRVVDPASGRVDFVLLTADPESPLDDVARALATVQPRPLVFSTGPGAGSPVGGPTRLRDSGLRDGTELSTTFQAAAPPDAPFEVAVVAGPDAGRSTPLGMDEPVLVGRDDECQLCLRYDDGTSRRHLALSVDRLGPLAQDIGSTNGTALDGRLLSRVSRVGPNDQLDLGATSVVVRSTPAADADLRTEEDGTLAFNRPARIRPGTSERRVTFPAPPPESDPPPFPWLQALAPLVVAGAALVVFHRPEMLLFALLSPVVMVGNSIANRRRRTRKDGAARARFVAASSEATARLASLAREELLSARSGAPDLAELVAIATGPGRRLWERRSADGDFLVLRVGSHTRPAAVVTTGLSGAAPDPPLLYGAPVVVDLRSAGVLGLAGEPADTRGIARGLLGDPAPPAAGALPHPLQRRPLKSPRPQPGPAHGLRGPGRSRRLDRAASFAVLARSLGCPTRVAVGFRPSGRGGRRGARGRRLRLAGGGPDRRRVGGVRPRAAERAAPGRGGPPEAGGCYLPRRAGSHAADAPAPGPTSPPPLRPASGGRPWFRAVLGAGLIVAVLLSAVAGVVVAKRRRRRARRRVPDPGARVRGAWAEAADRLVERGFGRPPWGTPRDSSVAVAGASRAAARRPRRPGRARRLCRRRRRDRPGRERAWADLDLFEAALAAQDGRSHLAVPLDRPEAPGHTVLSPPSPRCHSGREPSPAPPCPPSRSWTMEPPSAARARSSCASNVMTSRTTHRSTPGAGTLVLAEADTVDQDQVTVGMDVRHDGTTADRGHRPAGDGRRRLASQWLGWSCSSGSTPAPAPTT